MAMEEYDFRVIQLAGEAAQDEKELNVAGADGFTLVQVISSGSPFFAVAYLQRPHPAA